ncbi:MAG: GTP-binding protein [Caldilineaceae bacterium]
MTTKVVLIGGFLGAGKTTLMLRAAQECVRRGATVGLITNDQGVQLVDTALAVQQDLPVREVTGGCFCCNFPDLMTALTQLQQAVQPDVVFAEPVGSCTDLMATVVRPILHYYPQRYTLAPLSVLFDGARSRGHDTPDVTYLYERQLDEAEYILFNKVDLLAHDAVMDQAAQVQRTHPGARASCPFPRVRVKELATGWMPCCPRNSAQTVLSIDYAVCPRAEAELGWLNTQGEVVATRPFLPQNWMTHFCARSMPRCRRNMPPLVMSSSRPARTAAPSRPA